MKEVNKAGQRTVPCPDAGQRTVPCPENDAATSGSVEQHKKKLKQSFIKMSIPIVLGVVVICFLSVAWFAMNNRVQGSGMTIAAADPKYEISVLTGGNNGIYYEDYHKLVQDSSAIVWQMVAEKNMDNYENESKGIHPGSCGVISFYVTPKVETIDLKFTFEVVGYVSKETGEEDNKVITMTALDQNLAPAKYLNGHILLFEERSGASPNYTYSKPILSNEDMKRAINSNTYTGIDKSKQVDIYWVWPQTLSTLVDATSCEKVHVTTKPFTSDSDYDKIVENVITYPDYYLKGVNSASQSQQEGEGESTTPEQPEKSLTEEIIARDYHIYGDYYDQADNDIGLGVDFVLLKLSVTEADSVGG